MKKLFYFCSLFLLTLTFNSAQAQESYQTNSQMGSQTNPQMMGPQMGTQKNSQMGPQMMGQQMMGPYVVVTASNDPNDNQLLVYNSNGKLIQTISTQGKGGVAPNITGGGINKFNNLVAVVNYDSQNVSLFKQQGGSFKLVQMIPALSKPVSVAFGHGHLYILGESTVESHPIMNDRVMDRANGSSRLLVGDGTGAQVGVLPNHLIISERSNMIELAQLHNGAVTSNLQPVQLPPPPGNDTPVGLVTRDDAAYVTIAHSDKVGLVKNGKLVKLLSSQSEHAPCWLTLYGPWLYCSNTPSKTISRYDVTPDSIQLAELIATRLEQGGPSDIDADNGILGVLDTTGPAHISQYQIDNQGKLKLLNTISTATSANGVAVIKLMP